MCTQSFGGKKIAEISGKRWDNDGIVKVLRVNEVSEKLNLSQEPYQRTANPRRAINEQRDERDAQNLKERRWDMMQRKNRAHGNSDARAAGQESRALDTAQGWLSKFRPRSIDLEPST